MLGRSLLECDAELKTASALLSNARPGRLSVEGSCLAAGVRLKRGAVLAFGREEVGAHLGLRNKGALAPSYFRRKAKPCGAFTWQIDLLLRKTRIKVRFVLGRGPRCFDYNTEGRLEPREIRSGGPSLYPGICSVRQARKTEYRRETKTALRHKTKTQSKTELNY